MNEKEKIHALSEELITNLGRLVAIDSQLGTPEEGKPFGKGPAKALEEGLKIAEELGFHTVNLDNYCGYAEIGEGEEIIGIAGHLDIVPAGHGNRFSLPEKATICMGGEPPMIRGLFWKRCMRQSF